MVKASISIAKEGAPSRSVPLSMDRVWSTSELNSEGREIAEAVAVSGVRDINGVWIKAVRSVLSMMTTLEMFSEGGSSGQAGRPSEGWNKWSNVSA